MLHDQILECLEKKKKDYVSQLQYYQAYAREYSSKVEALDVAIHLVNEIIEDAHNA